MDMMTTAESTEKQEPVLLIHCLLVLLVTCTMHHDRDRAGHLTTVLVMLTDTQGIPPNSHGSHPYGMASSVLSTLYT